MKTLEYLLKFANLFSKIFLEIPRELALIINQWINNSPSSQKFICYKLQENALWRFLWFSHRTICHLLRAMENVHIVLGQKNGSMYLDFLCPLKRVLYIYKLNVYYKQIIISCVLENVFCSKLQFALQNWSFPHLIFLLVIQIFGWILNQRRHSFAQNNI